MTLSLPMPIDRLIPPPSIGKNNDSLPRRPRLPPNALDDIDMLLVIDDKRNALRPDPIGGEFREENVSPLPPPAIRYGINPLRLPP